MAEAAGHRQIVGDEQHPQAQTVLELRQQGEHLRLDLGIELVVRHAFVGQAHGHRLGARVASAEVPDLAGLLLADKAGQVGSAEAAVEAAHAGPGLAEACVVGGDGEVAHDVEHMAATDRVPRDHRDDRLGRAPNLDLEVEHVETTDAVLVLVPVVAAHALVAARAEGALALAAEDDDAHVLVVLRVLERPAHLVDGARREAVADVGTVDRDLGDALGAQRRFELDLVNVGRCHQQHCEDENVEETHA